MRPSATCYARSTKNRAAPVTQLGVASRRWPRSGGSVLLSRHRPHESRDLAISASPTRPSSHRAYQRALSAAGRDAISLAMSWKNVTFPTWPALARLRGSPPRFSRGYVRRSIAALVRAMCALTAAAMLSDNGCGKAGRAVAVAYAFALLGYAGRGESCWHGPDNDWCAEGARTSADRWFHTRGMSPISHEVGSPIQGGPT